MLKSGAGVLSVLVMCCFHDGFPGKTRKVGHENFDVATEVFLSRHIHWHCAVQVGISRPAKSL